MPKRQREPKSTESTSTASAGTDGSYPLEAAKNRLESAGLRMTSPRVQLLEAIIADHGPFSVDEILALPRARGMDRVTVYRGLQTFEEIGLVSRCEFGDGVRKIRISNRLHPTPRGAQMGWNRVMHEVMRSFFADFRAWPRRGRGLVLVDRSEFSAKFFLKLPR
jgi:hypothetical protein